MGYHRSISFNPSPSPSSSSSPSPLRQFSLATAKSKFRHRSTSLPCRSDPLLSHLDEHSLSVRSWARSDGATTSISDGLSLLSRLLSSLLDLLHHPQAAEPLRCHHRSEKLLEDLLRLADAHSCFRNGLLSLNQTLTETRAAVRRRDATRLATAFRAQRCAERELAQLATSAREIARFSRFSTGKSEALLTISICDSVAVAASASARVFSCVVGMSVESVEAVRGIADSAWDQCARCPIPSLVRFSTPTASPLVKVGPTRKVWWVVDVLRWRWRSKKRSEMNRESKEAVRGGEEVKGEELERRVVLERLLELEKCVGETENGCAEIYRALVNARVSLLNILTPNF